MKKQLFYKVLFCFFLCNCAPKTENPIDKPILQVYWSGALMYTNSSYEDCDGGDKFEEYMVVSFINPSNQVLGIDLSQGSPSSIKLISRDEHDDFRIHPFRKLTPNYLTVAPKDTVVNFFSQEKEIKEK